MFTKLLTTTLLSLILFVPIAFAAGAEANNQPAPEAKATPAKADQAKDTQAKADEAPSKDGDKLIAVEKQMVEQTNAQRVKYGLPPLAIDQSLEKTARSHAVWMTNNHAMQHSNQNVGENIAMGQHTTGEAVTDWMNSPGHRANILNSSYKRTGVAAFQTPDGTIYWCQQFLP